jgi:hypothetical protein
MSKIGINVIEAAASDAPFIAGADIGSVGVLMESRRGVPNKATLVTSPNQFQELFGSANPSDPQYGYFVVRGLFRNCNEYGANVYCVRIVGTSGNEPTTAVGTLTSGGAIFESLDVGATTTINAYNVTIEAGSVSGKKITIKNKTSNPDYTRVFNNLPDTMTAVLAINYGLAGYNNGNPATFSDSTKGVRIKSIGGDWPDDCTGSTLTTADIVTPGSLTVIKTAVTETVLGAGQYGQADPGIWANDLKLWWNPSPGREDLRDLYIYLTVGGDEVLVESWSNLSESTFAATLNSASSGSKYIRVVTAGSLPNGQTAAIGFASMTTPTAGSDGISDNITESDYTGVQASGTGIYAFDAVDIQIVTSAEFQTQTMAKILKDYAEGRKDCMAVACTAQSASISSLYSAWTNYLGSSSSALALYRSWLEVDNEASATVWVPNVGHVIGAGYIRKVLDGGGLPHIAPAGYTTALRDVISVEFPRYNDTDLLYLVRTARVNPVMSIPGAGFVIRTSRTTASLAKYQSIHVRRSILYLISSLKSSLGWLEQATNNGRSRSRAKDTVMMFLSRLYDQGMFNTDGGLDNNVSVICDRSNNTDDVVAAKRMVMNIRVRIVECIEEVDINLEYTQNSLITANLT